MQREAHEALYQQALSFLRYKPQTFFDQPVVSPEYLAARASTSHVCSDDDELTEAQKIIQMRKRNGLDW